MFEALRLDAEEKRKLTSIKCHRLGEYDWPVERDEDGLLVRRAANLFLQSVPQADPGAEIRHLVEI